MAAVAARIAHADPDVVVVDHVRAHWDGAVDRSVNRFSGAPEIFALHEWPAAIEILHTPWNKIIRRSLLLATGFEFRTGWYEDVPFTYRVLLAADRITLLDRVGVNYRQRRIGAATRTVGEGHFAIFPQLGRGLRHVRRQPRPARPSCGRCCSAGCSGTSWWSGATTTGCPTTFAAGSSTR